MRRKLMVIALLVASSLTLSGCVRPSGVDGNLTDDWALPDDPKLPIPTAPACYDMKTTDPAEVPKWPASIDCTTSHTVETIYVGQFEGVDAERTSPPLLDGPERRRAYDRCSSMALEYLGADWRTARIELFLVLPIELHWDAGARWYRCDVMEYKDLQDYAVVSRQNSVKGALSAPNTLSLGCMIFTSASSSVDKMNSSACTASHNGEFAGLYQYPEGNYPTDQAIRSKANLEGCRGVVAAFAGVPNDKDLQYRLGHVAGPFTKADWELGNRAVRCYIWLSKNATSSMKGVGVSALPIQYA